MFELLGFGLVFSIRRLSVRILSSGRCCVSSMCSMLSSDECGSRCVCSSVSMNFSSVWSAKEFTCPVR